MSTRRKPNSGRRTASRRQQPASSEQPAAVSVAWDEHATTSLDDVPDEVKRCVERRQLLLQRFKGKLQGFYQQHGPGPVPLEVSMAARPDAGGRLLSKDDMLRAARYSRSETKLFEGLERRALKNDWTIVETGDEDAPKVAVLCGHSACESAGCNGVSLRLHRQSMALALAPMLAALD